MELRGAAEHLREGASLSASGSALGSSRASRHGHRHTRDAIGRATLATLTSSAATVNETATYNGFGEPKTQKTCSGGTGTTCTGGTTFYEVTSTTRDKLGRITALTETTAAIPGGPGASTVTWGYTYDEAGRLKTVAKTGATTITYTYDAGSNGNGNRTGASGGEVITTGTIDGQDRLASQTRAGVTTAYTYTNNGSLLTSTSPTAAWTYAYDLQGNLRSATKSGTSITYLVDGRNRRVGKLGGTLPAKYVYDDQLRIVAELDVTSGAPTHVYAYGEKSNVPELVYQPVTAKTYRIVSDVRGSVRLVLELPASGTPVVRQRIDYDAWGNATESVNTTTPADANFKRVSLGYAGGLWDRDTGFVRFGARDYDPNTGRWTAKDPVRFTGGVNLYAYSKDDPVNYVDATGLGPDTPDQPPPSGPGDGAPPGPSVCGGDGRPEKRPDACADCVSFCAPLAESRVRRCERQYKQGDSSKDDLDRCRRDAASEERSCLKACEPVCKHNGSP